MKYPKEYLDEIKLRLKVSQVVSKSIQLKISGAVDKDFAINDISFIYRRKGIK